MVDFECKPRYDIQDLLRIMELLRSPDGCPWDRAQTHQSIRRNMLEEAYEAGARDFGENKVQEILEKCPRMPEDARKKLQETLTRIINEGSGGLICIIL